MASTSAEPSLQPGDAAHRDSLSLSPDALHVVLSQLEFPDLLAASATCRQLRAAASAPQLWERLCRRRWAGSLTTSLFRGGPKLGNVPDYRQLFLQDNGWAWPQLTVQRYAGVRWADEIVALHPQTAADGSTTVAVSSCRELRLLRLDATPGSPLQVLRAANHSVHSGGRELWSSVTALAPADDAGGGEGWVAAGGCHGRLALYQLPPSGSTSPTHAALRPAAVLDFPGGSCLVSHLEYLPAQRRCAVLHDALALLRPVPQRSGLSVVDAASWKELGRPLRDVLDGYELAAAAAVGDSGAEFVAGSVKLSDDQASGWACQRCPPAAPAALCFHKSHAASAALCTFDCRAAQGMVARHSAHHRSLYPHLEAVRGHYLLTSHAGTPVACWDRRQMNGPVHDVQHLPRHLGPSLAAAALPLEHPDLHEPATSQALHLSATQDLLLGRADSGMCWLFDLSERLGWADGSHAGSWLQAARQSQAVWRSDGMEQGPAEGDVEMSEGPAGGEAEGGHLDESEWERAPLPLGCVGAPYEVWCSTEDEAAPLHWLPPPLAWAAPHRIVALAGLELEQKQGLFPAHAQGSPYPSNALVAATLGGAGGSGSGAAGAGHGL
ncbi:hypothetical protein ABPG75_003487 [Micractinium tetrahymenae]